MTAESWEVAAQVTTIVAAALSILFIWQKKRWLKKARSAVIMVFLWTRGKQIEAATKERSESR